MRVDTPDKSIALVIASNEQRRALAAAMSQSGASVMEFDDARFLSADLLDGVSVVFCDRRSTALDAIVRERQDSDKPLPELVFLGADAEHAGELLRDIERLQERVRAFAYGGHAAAPDETRPALRSDAAQDDERVELRPIADFVEGDDAPLETPMLDQGGPNWPMIVLLLVVIIGAAAYLIVVPPPPPTAEELATIAYEQAKDAERRGFDVAADVVLEARARAAHVRSLVAVSSCETLVAKEAWREARVICAGRVAREPAAAPLYAEVLIALGELERAQTLLRLRIVEAPEDADAWFAFFRAAKLSGEAQNLRHAGESFLTLESEGERADAVREALAALGGASMRRGE